jgi:hypothetical protein
MMIATVTVVTIMMITITMTTTLTNHHNFIRLAAAQQTDQYRVWKSPSMVWIGQLRATPLVLPTSNKSKCFQFPLLTALLRVGLK